MASGASLAVTTVYVYTPLEEKPEIRLLELQSGSGDDPIQVSLHVVSLDAQPQYEAISYCWGDATIKDSVLCEGKRIDVTASLFTALRRFRRVDASRVLWADAICIQQSDLNEKENQVLLMPQIYSKASRMLIWLGADDADVRGVDVSIAQALEFLPSMPIDAQSYHQSMQRLMIEAKALQKESKPNFLDHDWTSFFQLLRRPWFGRKWVVQEVCHATSTLVICGDVEFPWDGLATVAFRCTMSGIINMLVGNSSLASTTAVQFDIMAAEVPLAAQNIEIMMMIRMLRSQGNLLDCVMSTPLFSCTDLRDHVYALLSLTPSGNCIRPNYKLSVAEVYTNFAVTLLVEQQNLKVLAIAPHITNPMMVSYYAPVPLQMPSWAPNLSGSGLVNPLSTYTVFPQAFHAGGDHTPLVRVSADRKLLYCQGRILDTARKLVDSAVLTKPFETEEWEPFMPLFQGRRQLVLQRLLLRRWLLACKALVLEGTPGQTDLTPAQWLTLGRAMTCEMTGKRDPLPPGSLDAFDEYVGHAIGVFEPGGAPEDAAAELLTMQYGAMIEMSVMAMALPRMLCRTEEGRLAQVPWQARAGDVFAVLLGAETPFVLRPIGEGEEQRYRLIGQCYVGGIMQGESLQDEKYTTTEIVLQ